MLQEAEDQILWNSINAGSKDNIKANDITWSIALLDDPNSKFTLAILNSNFKNNQDPALNRIGSILYEYIIMACFRLPEMFSGLIIFWIQLVITMK